MPWSFAAADGARRPLMCCSAPVTSSQIGRDPCLRDGGALRSLGWPQSDLSDDPNKPSTHILIDGRRRSWMSDGKNMLRTAARWSRRGARDCCQPRDRRAPPSRRRTDHDRSERTSPVPSGTLVVDARHPPPQPTIEPSCLAFVRAKKFRYRLGVNLRSGNFSGSENLN